MRIPFEAMAVVVAVMASGPALAGEETPIELSAVPGAIMDTAKGIVADMNSVNTVASALTFDDMFNEEDAAEVDPVPVSVTFVSANTETEDRGPDDFVYEIQGTLDDGRKVEFDIFPSGTVQEVEIEFTDDMVPGAVMNAIRDLYEGFTPTFIEASHSRSLQVVQYEVVGTAGGRTLDIEVSADGRRIVESDQ